MLENRTCCHSTTTLQNDLSKVQHIKRKKIFGGVWESSGGLDEILGVIIPKAQCTLGCMSSLLPKRGRTRLRYKYRYTYLKYIR